MEDLDPRKFDWPVPERGSDEESALAESLQHAAEGIRGALSRLPESKASGFIEQLSRAFEDSPAPGDSVAALERLFRQSPKDVDAFVTQALENPGAFRHLFVLAGHSRFLAGWLVKHGWRQFFQTDYASLELPVTRKQVADTCRELIDSGRSAEQALRFNHYRHMLRALAHEVLLGWPVENIADEVSALADAALDVALEQATRQLQLRPNGERPADFRFCVIALGKHGAQELNYSSDIDLMFVYDGGDRNAQRYAVKLAETLIPLIDERTENGHVFRVDTRLRPEGKRGRLARDVDSTVSYYFSFGTTLERQALIKARAAAGDTELGEQLIARLQTWVYRKYLSIDDINKIKSLKRRIEKRTEDRDEAYTDVKTGFGGIRDIEFVTQFLQLLNGGRLLAVRQTATLAGLNALAESGVLRDEEAKVLAEAYRFLRATEHRLQIRDGIQTHTVPTDPAGLHWLGQAMGFQGRRLGDPSRGFIKALRAHTLQARGLMLRLFADLFSGHTSPLEGELVLDGDMTPESAAVVLRPYGFRDTVAAFHAIRDLARESEAGSFYQARATKYLASMMPTLLAFCGDSPQPDVTLRNFERITGALGAKAVFFELVAEDSRALQVFGAVAAHSNWMTNILARRPGLVDEFVDELQTFSSLDAEALRKQLEDRMQYAKDPTDALFWERDVELLRIGFFDLTGRTPLPETLRELSALAEVLLNAALDVSIAEVCERKINGKPAGELLRGDPRDALSVIGMGKLGAGAMNYASDLDLVFAYDPEVFAEHSQAQTFYTRVVRRLIDLLGTSGERGRLYEVDLRLRPRGRAGNLAITLDELKKYLGNEAGFWERVAACRARVLNPDTEAGAAAVKTIEGFVYNGAADVAQTLELRERLEHESPHNALKRGVGGTLDVEFLLAHLQLKHGKQVPAMQQPGVWEVLEAAREHELIEPEDYDAIAGAYAFLRQVVNRLQIFDGVSRHELPEDDDGLNIFARRMGYTSSAMRPAEQLVEELDWHRGNARAVFRRIVSD